MDWRKYYMEHTMTPEEAVMKIKDGNRVMFGHAVGEPIVFQRTMARLAERFHNVEVAHMVYLGNGEYLEPGMESHFRHNALFVGGKARKAIASNRADYTPAFFSDVPRMIRDNTLPVDVFAFTCSPRISSVMSIWGCPAITAIRRCARQRLLSRRSTRTCR